MLEVNAWNLQVQVAHSAYVENEGREMVKAH